MEVGAVIKHDIKKATKTGEWRYMEPEVDEKKCIGCGTCVKYCPESVISLEANNTESEAEKKVAKIDYEFCKGCGVCANVCPAKAISMRK